MNNFLSLSLCCIKNYSSLIIKYAALKKGEEKLLQKENFMVNMHSMNKKVLVPENEK
jgi:hypothetical protein